MFFLLLLIISSKCSDWRQASESVTTSQLNKELDEIANDSADAINTLTEEILLRQSDSTSQKKTVEIIDSTLILGDTITWRVVKRTIERNETLEKYAKDSLIKLLQKKVIYPTGGGDNRKDWYELGVGSQARATTLQTACLIKRSRLYERPDGNFELRTRSFNEAKNLCNAERFYSQPVAGFCSGFGVSDNLFVTAGHCIETESDLHSFYVVYNFNQEEANRARLVFSPQEVYTPVEVVHKEHSGGKDFAIIRLDKAIPANRRAVLRTTDVAINEPVSVIGHPCGLPLKYADGATVLDISSPDFFTADLDTYGGNSGSPVYDASHRVVGILVRGARDFQFNYTDNCYYSNVCPSVGAPNCAGEGVSRVSQFYQFIPEN